MPLLAQMQAITAHDVAYPQAIAALEATDSAPFKLRDGQKIKKRTERKRRPPKKSVPSVAFTDFPVHLFAELVNLGQRGEVG
eukprot:3415962-Amphidinium_carterae.1